MSCNTLNDFTKDTAKNFELDAGVLLINVTDPGELDPAKAITAGAKKLGASTGGKSIDFSMEIRNLFEDVDGARGKYKGGDAIDMRDAALSVTLLEHTADNFKLALAAADLSDNTAGGKTITPRNCINDSDYITNVCWYGTLKGFDKPMCIELKNCLNESFSWGAEDKSKGTIELELHPRRDLANPDESEFLIHLPPTTSTPS